MSEWSPVFQVMAVLGGGGLLGIAIVYFLIPEMWDVLFHEDKDR